MSRRKETKWSMQTFVFNRVLAVNTIASMLLRKSENAYIYLWSEP